MNVVQTILTAYPSVFSDQKSAETLDHGGKILLPSKLLEELTNKRVPHPFQFRIQSKSSKRECYCGVLEFTAREGEVIIPLWAFTQLCINEGDQVRLSTCGLPHGHEFLVTFRPHEKAFIDLSDPRLILQNSLKSYTVLSEGSTIAVRYMERTFLIDVTRIVDKKKARHAATLIIDCDVHAEFDRPLDMPPSPEQKPLPAPSSAPNVIGGGGAATVDFTPVTFKPPSLTAPKKAEAEKPAFKAFGGQGRTLKGGTAPAATPEGQKKEEDKPQGAFSGKARYLK